MNSPSFPNDDSAELECDKLTYSWYNLDAFGAVHQPGTHWKQIVNRVKGILCNERHIPAPRKHLLKNGKQIIKKYNYY